MLKYILRQSVRILLGAGTVGQVGEIIESIGKKKVFLATDKGIVKAGIADKVIASLKNHKIDYFLFDEILPDAPARFAEQGYELLKKENCDCAIALGGGSTIDTTKAINLLRYHEGPILKYTAGPPVWETIKPCPGLIAIPTTAGTGSEMSDGIIISDESHKKLTILSQNLMPEYSVLDPELLLGVPPQILVSTGLDALSHLVETFLIKYTTPMTEIISLAGAKVVLKWLPIALDNPTDLESRSNLMCASALGGWMLANVCANSGHSFAHVMGSEFGMAHGFGCAYAMPVVTEFNAVAIPERTKKVGEAYGVKFAGNESPEKIGAMVYEAMVKFRDETLKLKKIKEFPYHESKFDEMAGLVLKEAFQFFNPRDMDKDQALALLKKIYI